MDMALEVAFIHSSAADRRCYEGVGTLEHGLELTGVYLATRTLIRRSWCQAHARGFEGLDTNELTLEF